MSTYSLNHDHKQSHQPETRSNLEADFGTYQVSQKTVRWNRPKIRRDQPTGSGSERGYQGTEKYTPAVEHGAYRRNFGRQCHYFYDYFGVTFNIWKQNCRKSVRRSVSHSLSLLGVLAMLVFSTSTISAAEKLAGDIFIHVAGYSANTGAFQFKTEPSSDTIKVFYRKIDDGGTHSSALIRKIPRKVFSSQLQRVGDDARWKIGAEALSKIIQNNDQRSSSLGKRPDGESELLNLSFSDFQFATCEGKRGLKKLRCHVQGGELDVEQYQELAAANEQYDALVAEGKRLDEEYVAITQRVKTKKNVVTDQQKIIEAQKEKLARLKKLEAWAKSQVGKKID